MRPSNRAMQTDGRFAAAADHQGVMQPESIRLSAGGVSNA